MNEKIKELVNEVFVFTDDGRIDYANEYMVQRFAELIVKECLNIVNRIEYSYHEADPLWETAQLIKQHFGVK